MVRMVDRIMAHGTIHFVDHIVYILVWPIPYGPLSYGYSKE